MVQLQKAVTLRPCPFRQLLFGLFNFIKKDNFDVIRIPTRLFFGETFRCDVQPPHDSIMSADTSSRSWSYISSSPPAYEPREKGIWHMAVLMPVLCCSCSCFRRSDKAAAAVMLPNHTRLISVFLFAM